MGIKAIIWDLDGTIVHFKIDFYSCRKVAIEILKKNGIPKNKLTTQKSILENIKTSKGIFKSMGYTPKKVENILKKVDDEINKVESEAAEIATMINGIDIVLEFVKKNKLKQAIYTLNSTKNAKKSLEKVNLLPYFDLIVGRHDIDNPKPHPEHLLHICNQLSLNPSEILVIGDNFRDIEGAQSVNAHSIALHTRFAKVETLQNADKIIEENEIPSKLIKAIQEIMSKLINIK